MKVYPRFSSRAQENIETKISPRDAENRINSEFKGVMTRSRSKSLSMSDSRNERSERKIIDQTKAIPSPLGKKVLSVAFPKKIEGIAKRDREEPFSQAKAALKKRKMETPSDEKNELLDALLNACEKEREAHLASVARLSSPQKEIDESEDKKISRNYKIVYPQGDIYEGELKSWYPHGQGKLIFSKSNNTCYKGPFEDQFHIGFASYEGEFKKEQLDGYGTFQFKNGDVYKGELKNGMLHGKGSFLYKNGTVFEGRFCDSQACGSGTFTFPNGDTYESTFTQGIIAERGILRFKNGDIYTGPFPGFYHAELIDCFDFT